MAFSVSNNNTKKKKTFSRPRFKNVSLVDYDVYTHTHTHTRTYVVYKTRFLQNTIETILNFETGNLCYDNARTIYSCFPR